VQGNSSEASQIQVYNGNNTAGTTGSAYFYANQALTGNIFFGAFGPGVTNFPSVKGMVAGAGDLGVVASSGKFYVRTGGGTSTNERLTVTSTGLVGINETSPAGVRLNIRDTTTAQLRLTRTTSSVYTDFTTTASGYLGIQPTGSRIGINTISPATALDVLGTTRISQTIGSVFTDFSTNSSGYLAISPSGARTGIGTTSPTNTLHVNGTVRVGTLNSVNSAFVLADANGVLGKQTAFDARLLMNAYAAGGAVESEWVMYVSSPSNKEFLGNPNFT
jgi:hypothetical protein